MYFTICGWSSVLPQGHSAFSLFIGFFGKFLEWEMVLIQPAFLFRSPRICLYQKLRTF